MALVASPSKGLIDEVVLARLWAGHYSSGGDGEVYDVAIGVVCRTRFCTYHFAVVETNVEVGVYDTEDSQRSIKRPNCYQGPDVWVVFAGGEE
jgi:hypothetical protein